MNDPNLTVAIPAYNEELQLASTVRSVLTALEVVASGSEVVVVDDGSFDRTPEVADTLGREHPSVVRVLHQANQGIGGALRSAATSARGVYLILWPADMPATPDDLRPFVERLGQADVIVGVRRRRVGYTPIMRLNAWIYARLVRLLFGLRLRDVNWICAYRRALLLQAAPRRRGIAMLSEALVRVRDLGGTFMEVDVAMKRRVGGVAAASRFSVMRKTLFDLLAFWWEWRRGRK